MAQSRIAMLLNAKSPELVTSLTELMQTIVKKVNDLGQDCSAELAEIERLTGISYSPSDFFELWGWTDEDALAGRAARGSPPILPDLSREELLEAIAVCEGHKPDVQQFMIDVLSRSLPGIFDSDLIFYPFKDLSTEQIVDEVIFRRDLKNSGGQVELDAYYRKTAEEVLHDPESKPWSRDWAEGIMRRLG